MDFTELEGTISQEEDKLTRQDTELRRTLYVEFANTNSLSQLHSAILNRFKEYINENVLQPNHNGDILYSFFEENQYRPTMKDIGRIELTVQERFHSLFPLINVSQQITTKSNKIGYQHLYILSNTSSSSESSNISDPDPDVMSWDADAARLKEKLKRCQQTIEVDLNTALEYHNENNTQITGTAVHVDILIFIDKRISKKLAEYLGLIYVEDLLIAAKENEMDDVIYLLDDDDAKLYSLIQSYINKKLISGCNNICLVNTSTLWENFRANVRAVISIKDDDLYFEAIETSNFCVELGKDSSLIDHVEAVALIVNKALRYETHVIAKYQYDQDSYCTIKLPLISILPLYVLRYFTLFKIKEQSHGLL